MDNIVDLERSVNHGIDAIIDEILGETLDEVNTDKSLETSLKLISIPKRMEDSVGKKIAELLRENGFKEKFLDKKGANKTFLKGNDVSIITYSIASRDEKNAINKAD